MSHQIPVENLGRLAEEHESLGVGDDLGGVESLTDLEMVEQ